MSYYFVAKFKCRLLDNKRCENFKHSYSLYQQRQCTTQHWDYSIFIKPNVLQHKSNKKKRESWLEIFVDVL